VPSFVLLAAPRRWLLAYPLTAFRRLWPVPGRAMACGDAVSLAIGRWGAGFAGVTEEDRRESFDEGGGGVTGVIRPDLGFSLARADADPLLALDRGAGSGRGTVARFFLSKLTPDGRRTRRLRGGVSSAGRGPARRGGEGVGGGG